MTPSLQELSRFTDVNFHVKGSKLSAHLEILGKLSPFLSDLLNKQSCCQCHGRDCCKKGDSFGITLAGFDKASVEHVLELIYTGISAN